MNLLRALTTISALTLLSRILGFVRDFVIARSFGAGAATDAFFVAFRLPNLLRRLFAEGAFSQAFVPILAEVRRREGDDGAVRLVGRVAALLTAVVALVALLGVIAAPLVVMVSAPGFTDDADKFALTVALTRLTFPYIAFMALVALSAGVLNTWSRFAVPAFTPVLLNLSFIGMALFAAPWFDPPIVALAWAVLIGGLLQLAMQWGALARLGLMPRFRWAPGDPDVRRILALMAPALLGVSVAQVSLLINTMFASFLETGSVSWLYFADRLMEFPAGLIGAALGTVLLPSLSREHADRDVERYSALLDWGLRLTLLLCLPAALALALLAVPLISTLFMHDAFQPSDVLATSRALVAYSIGLTGMIAVKVLAPGFYAQQNIRTPVRIAIVSLVATQVMNLAFIGPLQHVGLALSIALAALLNAALLLAGLRQSGAYRPAPGWTGFLVRILGALLTMAALLILLSPPESWWLETPFAERGERMLLLVVSGASVYFAALYAFGFRPRDFRRMTKA